MDVTTGMLTVGELAGVARVMRERGVEITGPLEASLIVGGRSNLTYRLRDSASAPPADGWVLRTPPRAGRTPSAHDVAREYRVTAALADTAVPVPTARVLHEAPDLLGGPFAVCDYVPGRGIQTRDDLDLLDDADVALVATRLVETLVDLHQVDQVAVGLEDFGRSDGYAQRQLRRWAAQWELVGDPALTAQSRWVSSRLAELVPPQRATSIVHGDFRIDNTILAPGESAPAGLGIAAVVDWELSTIGDPVADVATMCAYRDVAFDLIVGAPSAWASPRLPSVDTLAGLYERSAGGRLDGWEFHLALAYFKVAVIAAGIEHRRAQGSGHGAGFDTAGQAVEPYLARARHSLSHYPRRIA